jgi:hypothetical protein
VEPVLASHLKEKEREREKIRRMKLGGEGRWMMMLLTSPSIPINVVSTFVKFGIFF